VLFCLHCNGAVEHGLDPSADCTAPARASNGMCFSLHVSLRCETKCVRRSGPSTSRPSPQQGFSAFH
jgi:hypothetical protein